MNGRSDELVKLLARRYVQRRDLKAKQDSSGAYAPVRSRFTKRDLTLHLQGKVTYGHYLVDHDGRCRVLCYDIDFDKNFLWEGRQLNPREVFGTDHPARSALTARIRSLADGLAFALKRRNPELTVTTSFSGSKGVHVLGSFPEATTARAAREIAIDLLDWFGCFQLHLGKNFYKHAMGSAEGLTLEIYPKQEEVGVGGFGNLLRLPLGIHQKTRRPSFFYDPGGDATQFQRLDPREALTCGLVLKK